MEVRARLHKGERGHVLYLFPAAPRRGYVTIDADLDSQGPADPTAVCGLISDRDTGECDCEVLDTPERMDAFLARALAFLSRGEVE